MALPFLSNFPWFGSWVTLVAKFGNRAMAIESKLIPEVMFILEIYSVGNIQPPVAYYLLRIHEPRSQLLSTNTKIL